MHRIRTRSRWAVGAVAASLALVTACSPAPQDAAGEDGGAATTVRVGPLQDPNYLTVTKYAGSLDDALTEAGASTEWVPAFPAFAPTAEALRGGSVDIGSGSSTSFLTAIAGNRDLVVFAVERDSGLGQGIVARDGIGSVRDLVGKRVAVNQGGTGEYLLRLALEQEDIDPSELDIVYLAPTDAATAFSQGHVDAWAVWDQFFATAQTVPGAKVIATGKDLGSLNRIVHVTTREFAERNPELVGAVYGALKREADAASSDNGRIADLAAEQGVPPEVADIIRAVPPATIEPAGPDFERELGEVATFYADQGLSDDTIDVTGSTIDASGAAGS
ncbi:ABC transporter substrate-binding protein [Prauserella cavernicola]|uniref:ABC transporter substrate-binding protein n=1 Tax=Prauserella cavernicola TaxID=2800127 RepID=A0A934QPH1_9PSEU|nr:ABC transporter substrate-binding protein [Prauserella cavernicola]MBK1783706.1 ABC transporter substrate-binding protein [Prauserella cavernicola]